MLGTLLFAGGAYFGYLTFSHVKVRVGAWLDPFSDYDAYFQVINAQFGMAWGGLLGTGLGLGRPGLTPLARSDFIAAAIGEELGMTGLMAVIMIYGLIVARGLRTALQCREPFGKLLAAGLSFAFALQVFTIIGGVTRLLPLTGLTTPFMSQGGSSLVSNWVVIALLLVISHQVRKPVVTVTPLDPDAQTTQLMKASMTASGSHQRDRASGESPRERRESRPGDRRSEKRNTFFRSAASDDDAGFQRDARAGKHMNKPIRRVAFVAMIMFGLLLANGTYMMLVRQSSLAEAPQNRRVRDAEFAQNRGAILAAGKTEIATTEPTDDSFKYQRVYPEGERYAPITGFYSYDHSRTALETSYNSQLAGTDDALFVRRLIDLVTNRTPQGASVQTTIVPKVQRAAAKALGDQKGAVVALDPSTGAVLAMVTSPSYDPNEIASHDIEAADEAYQRLANDPDRPLANRAAREIYPPGSTFKLVTAAAALADGKTADSKVKSPDRLKLPGTNTFLRQLERLWRGRR